MENKSIFFFVPFTTKNIIDFYEVDDINILILDKDTSKHKFLSKEKKDLYTYDGNNWQLDFPSYKLRINKLNFDYNLVGHYY